jgi:hypothetical protein
MTEPLENLLAAIKGAADALRSAPGDPVIAADVDADGICAAYIVGETIGLLRKKSHPEAAYEPKYVFIERPFLPLLHHLNKVAKGPVIFADHGGGSEEDIARESRDRLTIVLDHHGSNPMHETMELPRNFHCCNGNHWRVDGDRYATASTLAYLLMRELVPDKAPMYAHIALLGAAGDGTPWKYPGWPSPNSVDSFAYQDALLLHHDDALFVHEPEARDKDDQLLVHMPDDNWYGAKSLSDSLTYLGMVRRLELKDKRVVENGPASALKALQDGPAKGDERQKQGRPRGPILGELCKAEITALFDSIWRKALVGELHSSYNDIAYFLDVDDECNNLWPKAVGHLAKYITKQIENAPRLPHLAYVLVGMPLTPSSVLGKDIAPYQDNNRRLKVSIRCPPKLEELIKRRLAPQVNDVCRTYMEKENSHSTRGAGIPKGDPMVLPADIRGYCEYKDMKFWEQPRPEQPKST